MHDRQLLLSGMRRYGCRIANSAVTSDKFIIVPDSISFCRQKSENYTADNTVSYITCVAVCYSAT